MKAIRDYVLGFFDGPHATPKEVDHGPVFLGIRNVTPDGRLDLSDIRHVSEQDFPRWTKRVKPQLGDVVFSYEATLHRYALIPEGFEGCLGRRMALIRPDPDKLDARFLHFYLLSPGWRNQVDANVITGATVNRLPLTKVPGFAVEFPELTKQKEISVILAAYDDLIENNRRRIALLEEAARQLYKEWFVRFRFPGHEHVKIIDGVPNGWTKMSFSELAEVVRGRSYTSAELRDEGGRPFVNLKCINRFGGFRDSGLKGIQGVFKEKHMVVPGDIVMAVTDMTRDAMIVAQSGRISKTVEAGAIFSMDLVKIVPKPEVQRDWLYSILRFSRFAFDVREHANGTNVLHLKPKHIEDWKGVVPPQNVREWFVDAVQVMFDQIDNLQLQSRNLAKARDLLLPKLMSGAIAV